MRFVCKRFRTNSVKVRGRKWTSTIPSSLTFSQCGWVTGAIGIRVGDGTNGIPAGVTVAGIIGTTGTTGVTGRRTSALGCPRKAPRCSLNGNSKHRMNQTDPLLDQTFPDDPLHQWISLLVLQPSPFCNINCDYCYLPNRASKKRMPLEIVAITIEKSLRPIWFWARSR